MFNVITIKGELQHAVHTGILISVHHRAISWQLAEGMSIVPSFHENTL